MGYFLCQQLIGHAGIGVLLVNGAGHPQLCCHTDHRTGYIAAGTDGNIRAEAGDNLLCPLAGCSQIAQRLGIPLDILQTQPALKACHIDKLNGIACLGNESGLHTVGCAGKQELRPGIMLPDNGRNSQSRIDMSPGSAAGK